jgi:hypothetical protein
MSDEGRHDSWFKKVDDHGVLYLMFRALLMISAIITACSVVGGAVYVMVDIQKTDVFNKSAKLIEVKMEGEASERIKLEGQARDLRKRVSELERQIITLTANRIWLEVYITHGKDGRAADVAARKFMEQMQGHWPCPEGLTCASPSEAAQTAIGGRY